MNSLYKTIDNILKENNINNKEMDEAILKNGIISGLLSKDEEYIQSMTSYQDPTKFYDFDF